MHYVPRNDAREINLEGEQETNLPVLNPTQTNQYAGLYAAKDTSCYLKPLGILDLLRVEQRLCAYTAGEVAHIENLMAGEEKDRSTRHLTRTTDTLTTDKERSETTQRDSQSTERFELQKEAKSQIQKSMALSAGLNASYNGGVTQVSANANFSMQQSSDEMNRTASNFAREITEKASHSVSERVREVRTTTRLEEFEEVNRHGLNNLNGTKNVVGVYRWVDKEYNCFLRNYGRHLMFELMIPEPAKLHLWAMQNVASTAERAGITPPIAPDKLEVRKHNNKWQVVDSPDMLDRYNVNTWAAVYGISIEQMPAETTIVSASEAGTGNGQSIGKIMTIPIPDGYEAQEAYISLKQDGITTNDLHIVLSQQQGIIGKNKTTTWKWGTATANTSIIARLEGVRTNTTLAITGASDYYGVDVKLTCKLTDEAIAAWKLKTYNAIWDAYRQQLETYKSSLSALEAQAGIQIQGQNPAINRQTEQTELKRATIEMMLTHGNRKLLPNFWTMNTINEGTKGDKTTPPKPPTINTCAAIAKGDMVRFFEQVFDWSLITYHFYPYFYAQQKNWLTLYQHQDADPLFMNFLQAGYARVLVPVRQGYEFSALNFLSTGALWNGNELPITGASQFIRDLIAEIKTMQTEPTPGLDAPKEYKQVGDAWKVKIPTTLVMLQTSTDGIADTGLPRFACSTEPAIGGEPSILTPPNSVKE